MFRTTHSNNYGALTLGMLVGSATTCLLIKVAKHNDMFHKFMAHKENVINKTTENVGSSVTEAVDKMSNAEKKENFEKFKDAGKMDSKNTADKMSLTD